MRWRIRAESDQPIYEQIEAQIVYAVANGNLVPGELIPSVRELAELLLVNPNTVSRAYQALERHGYVTVRRGKGMEVTADAKAACLGRRREMAAEHLRNALDEALGSGMLVGDVRDLVELLLNNSVNGKSPKEKR